MATKKTPAKKLARKTTKNIRRTRQSNPPTETPSNEPQQSDPFGPSKQEVEEAGQRLCDFDRGYARGASDVHNTHPLLTSRDKVLQLRQRLTAIHSQRIQHELKLDTIRLEIQIIEEQLKEPSAQLRQELEGCYTATRAQLFHGAQDAPF